MAIDDLPVPSPPASLVKDDTVAVELYVTVNHL